MSEIDFSKIIKNAVSGVSEKRIDEYKTFFKTHLLRVNRKDALVKLYPVLIYFQNAKPITPFLSNQKEVALITNTETVLKQFFSPEILKIFQKKTTTVDPKIAASDNDPLWLKALALFSGSMEAMNEAYKQDWVYKTQFLNFLYNCLYNYGLHTEIQQRDANIFKRYNILIKHNFKSKSEVVDYKILLTNEELHKEILTPYEKQLPIRLSGKLIAFKNIHSIQITSSLLRDDEIELFAKKHNFSWNDTFKEQLKFISKSDDETDNFQRNPYLIGETEKFRNQNTCFIHPDRIDEIRKLENKNYDLSKLAQMLDELNNTSSTKSHIATSLLVRGVIDHIPPILGCKNFAEVANNYSGGTQSFKKSMVNLDKSLRNIADNNIHSQARSKEVLPTSNQIDFTPELDLLLSEVVRVLK